MAKISFNKLNLKKDTTINVIKIGDVEIEVKNYLPIEEKMSLIDLVVQDSMEYGFVNPLKLEKYFNLYFVYKYTNISFSDANRKDEDALYDILETNGVIDAVVQASPDDYSYLFEKCEEYLEKYEKFQNSFYGMATKIVNSVPENMAEAMNMIDNLDLEKIAKTMKVAQLNAGNESALEVLVNGQNK